jgi:3-mercaptopyruvate sulfurtransferase SseA
MGFSNIAVLDGGLPQWIKTQLSCETIPEKKKPITVIFKRLIFFNKNWSKEIKIKLNQTLLTKIFDN